MTELKFHPVAEVFPMITGAEFNALVADIRDYGLRVPIILHPDGRILDGRNRYRACLEAGVQPKYEQWSGVSGDEVRYVVSLNLTRRHLDESQRSIVASRLATLGQGARTDLSEISGKLSQREAAELLNVSTDLVGLAKRVEAHGVQELVAAVERGEVAVSAAAEVAQLSKEEQVEVVARGEREILKAAKEIRARKNEDRRAERVDRLAAIAIGNSPLVSEIKYPIVYADPPWRYEHVETESRAIENQYPTMALDEIRALPVSDATTPDAVLFLWATSPKLAEAMSVIESWGFTYRTSMVWVKDRIGMGYYARQRHELLLIATKGSPPTPAPSDRPDSVVNAPQSKHSEKPDVFYGVIERMYGALPKLEMFSRKAREGWGRWGNQAA